MKLEKDSSGEDMFVFLGDYIDRGRFSFEVIERLIEFAGIRNCVFIKGNHEDMLLNYASGRGGSAIFRYNGGDSTLLSYRKHMGGFSFPDEHRYFFESLRLYFEGDDFIAVHAGLNPLIETVESQTEFDLLWIREPFYQSNRVWDKTVFFGHTPTVFISGKPGVFIDRKRRLVGVDNGVHLGHPLACVRWPDMKVFYSDAEN